MTTAHHKLLDRIIELHRSGRKFAVVTVIYTSPAIAVKPGTKALVTQDRRVEGWLGGSCVEQQIIDEALKALEDGEPRLVALEGNQNQYGVKPDLLIPNYCISGGNALFLIEPYSATRVIIVGDNAVARSVAELVRFAGMGVVKIDKDKLLDNTGLGESIGSCPVAVVATMGSYDDLAIKALLNTEITKILLVSSKRRWRALYSLLLSEGISSERLDIVKAPAGLDIGASSPEEIAISIAAELISILKGKDKKQPIEAVEEYGDEIEKDPVCGMVVRPSDSTSLEYDGKKYYFCCESCKRKFECNPELYVVS